MASSRFISRCLVGALLLLLASPAGRANPVRRASLVDLCRDAHVIVSGKIVTVRDSTDARTRLPIRTIVLRVREVLKSPSSGPRVRPGGFHLFRQYHHPGFARSHARPPSYSVGEEVVLFLAKTGRLGLTAPIGLSQGKFTVRTTGKGRTTRSLVTNALDNANLALTPEMAPGAPASRAAVRRLSGLNATRREEEILTRRLTGPLDYQAFVGLVRKLARVTAARPRR